MMAVWSEVRFLELGEAIRIDSEYYMPQYLDLEKLLLDSFKLNEILSYLTDGTHITPKYQSAGIPFLSSGNIQEFYLNINETRFISNEEHARLGHCQPDGLDVLLTKSGRIGHAAVVPKNMRKGSFNIYEGIALLRLKKYDPYVLAAALNSSVVQQQIVRRFKGVAQPHLHLEDIRRLRIPYLTDSQKRKIRKLVVSGIQQLEESQILYAHAEKLLLKELGLEELYLSPTLYYERRFSETQQAGRFDAEFFQPRCYRLLDSIEKTKQAVRLGDILSYCERGMQPEYDQEGNVAVVNTKHMGQKFLSSDLEYCTFNSWQKQKKAQLKQYDVLFYSTGAYIGRTNCWFENRRAIGSNHVTIIRPKDICNPIYLSVFLNSLAGLMQADRHAHGSAQREVYPNDIRDFTLWFAPQEIQEEISNLLSKGYEARIESLRLLEEAKAMVEKVVFNGK